MSNNLAKFTLSELTAEIERREKESKSLSKMKPVGTWKVTTEDTDCRGGYSKNLGTYKGHIADIAKMLADKCYYSLRFTSVNDEKANIVGATRIDVPITIDTSDNQFDLVPEEKKNLMKGMLHREAANNPYSVKTVGTQIVLEFSK